MGKGCRARLPRALTRMRVFAVALVSLSLLLSVGEAWWQNPVGGGMMLSSLSPEAFPLLGQSPLPVKTAVDTAADSAGNEAVSAARSNVLAAIKAAEAGVVSADARGKR